MGEPTHFVTFDLEDWHPGDCPRMTCTAPADAMCHAVWSCDCEWWCKDGIEDGQPWHAPGDFSEHEYERHIGKFDPKVCMFSDWAENSDECLRGVVTIPVTPEHDGDYVLFRAIPGKVEVS
jgi:hypothetical protein